MHLIPIGMSDKRKEMKKQRTARPLLSIKNLAIDFATQQGMLHAVRDLSLELYPRQLLALVGESGSGKSVTAHAILQLLPRHAHVQGEIWYESQPLHSANADTMRHVRGTEIAIIFQEPTRSFDPLYTIGKAFRETIRAHFPTINETEIYNRTIALLEEVSIDNASQRIRNYPHQFSGGQLQRINIALALASDPQVLIADEPTTALDLTIQAEIVALLSRLQTERNLAILFISHDIELVSQIADEIAIMYAGRILEYGTCTTMLQYPHHPYTAALLRATIQMGQHHRQTPLRAIQGSVPDPYHKDSGCPFLPRCEQAHEQCQNGIPIWKLEKTRHRCLIDGPKER